MSAPVQPHGPPEMMREFVAEMFAMARVQTELAQTYAEIGDDTGLEYATRKCVAYLKAAIPTVKELRGAQVDGGAS